MDKKVKIKLQNVDKTFHLGRKETNDIQVVFDVNLDIFDHDFVVICGPSGSGKSTILNIMIGLEDPTSGKVFHDDIDIYAKNQYQRAKMRLHKIGIIFQQSIWMKNMSVIENVAMPYFLSSHNYRESLNLAIEKLKLVKMEEFIRRLPSELSGGQQQKVALARALINDPEIIIADEPTGNLDTDSSVILMDQMLELNKKFAKTIVIVTHNLSYLKLAENNYYVKDGRLSRVSLPLKNSTSTVGEIEEMVK